MNKKIKFSLNMRIYKVNLIYKRSNKNFSKIKLFNLKTKFKYRIYNLINFRLFKMKMKN
jgi:hypothetical protein